MDLDWWQCAYVSHVEFRQASCTKSDCELADTVGHSYLVRHHCRAFPVVDVVLQVPITDAKLEVFKEFFVVH